MQFKKTPIKICGRACFICFGDVFFATSAGLENVGTNSRFQPSLPLISLTGTGRRAEADLEITDTHSVHAMQSLNFPPKIILAFFFRNANRTLGEN